MTTDMKQTGVPSASKGRMQLVNPVQANNSGMVGGQQAVEQRMQNRISENYNPIMAKGTGEADMMPKPVTRNVASQDQTNLNAIPTDLDNARTAFNKLTDKDKMSLLNEIAQGTKAPTQEQPQQTRF